MDDNYSKFNSDLIIKNRRKLKLFAALNNLHLGVTYVKHWISEYDYDYYWREDARYAIIYQFSGFDIIDRRDGKSIISNKSAYIDRPILIETFKEIVMLYEKVSTDE